jgi:glycosyltransferase 2 family protein
MKFRILQLGLGLGIMAMLVLMLLRVVDVQEVAAALRRADLRLVPAAVGTHVSAMWLRSMLWRRLLPSRPATRTLFQISVVGFAANYLMPVRLGELVRVYLVKKWCREESGPVLASLVAERTFDGLTVSAVLLVSLLFVPAPAYVLALGLTLAAVFTGLAGAIALARWRADCLISVARRATRPLPVSLASRLMHITHGFATNVGQFGGWRAVPVLIALAVSGWLAQFAVFYLIMYAFPLTASMPQALLDGSVANFATLLPSAPGSVGAFDAALVQLLVDIQGATLENAAAYALLVHSVIVLPIVTLGGLFVWRTNVSVRHLLTSAAASAASTTSQRSLNANGRRQRQTANHSREGLRPRAQTTELPTR